MKLTDRQVKNLKPQSNRYEVWEGKGFGIRIFPSGKKSWIYMYRFRGKARRLTLGHYPNMSVAAAHTAYGKALESLEMGIDPGVNKIQAKLADKQAFTVNDLINEYLEKWAKPRKRSWEEDERLLKKDVATSWGAYKAKDIKRRDVVLLVDKIAKRAPIAANRTLAVVRRMFNLAVERDILETSPGVAVKAPSKENRRERILSEDEIKIFWHTLDDTDVHLSTALALKMQLVTAQRKGEVVNMRWDELDLKAGTWSIPGEKSKNSKPHQVPLSALANEILSESKEKLGHRVWVFPSPSIDGPVTDGAISKAVRRHKDEFVGINHFTPHDLRRTAASHMTALGISRLVVSKILNHVERDVIAIYDRHSYDGEKRSAAIKWSEKLTNLINDKNNSETSK